MSKHYAGEIDAEEFFGFLEGEKPGRPPGSGRAEPISEDDAAALLDMAPGLPGDDPLIRAATRVVKASGELSEAMGQFKAVLAARRKG